MSDTKFTKGPWELGVSQDEDGIHCVDAMDNGVLFGLCKVYGENIDCEETETSKANAHLIAAAPEMYEALSDLVEALEGEYYCFKAARQALAKARGES